MMAGNKPGKPKQTPSDQELDEFAVFCDERKLLEARLALAASRIYWFTTVFVTPFLALIGYALLHYQEKARFILLVVPFLIPVAFMVLGWIYTEHYIAGHYGRYITEIVNRRLGRTPLLLSEIDYVFLARGFGLQHALAAISILSLLLIDVVSFWLAPTLLKNLAELIPDANVTVITIVYWVFLAVIYTLAVVGFVAQYCVKASAMRKVILERDSTYD